MLQFQLTLEEEKTVIINSEHPITFNYANMILREMGYSQNVKKITFLGKIKGL
jgi:hypothetical protein